MIRFLAIAASAALLAAPLGASAQDSPPGRPNIIIILTDDMGIGDVSCYGKGMQGVPTPNIDRLAREGTRFTQYYSPAPISSPSRAGLLTGQMPGRNRLNSYLQTRAGNIHCDQDDFLDPSVVTLPDALKAAGYATAHYGKWHLGGGRDVDNAPSIGEYGYDEWASTWESPDPHPDLGVQYAPWDRRKEPQQVERHDRTAYMVDRTLKFIREHPDQPCFINLWPDDVHTPHRPSPEMAAKHGASEDEKKTPRKSFLGVLEEYDRQIGRLIDGLEAMGEADNTIIIFTSDNGPEPHFQYERTGGLRGMKLSLYEGGINMPFIVRWPGHVPAGKANDRTVVSGLDMALTLCSLAGVEPPKALVTGTDGEDVSKAFLGEEIERTGALYWEYGRKSTGYGYPHRPEDRSPNVAIREGEWKLLVNDDATSRQLYNVRLDRKESLDLSEQNAELAEQLAARALEWRRGLPGRSIKSEKTQTNRDTHGPTQ